MWLGGWDGCGYRCGCGQRCGCWWVGRWVGRVWLQVWKWAYMWMCVGGQVHRRSVDMDVWMWM